MDLEYSQANSAYECGIQRKSDLPKVTLVGLKPNPTFFLPQVEMSHIIILFAELEN